MREDHPIFDQIIKSCQELDPVRAAVVYPLSEVALRGAAEAAVAGLITPYLVGPADEIRSLANKLGIDISQFPMEEAVGDVEAARLGVSLCATGTCGALMKGSLHTDHFMQPVMSDDTGLRTHRRISHTFVLDAPSYSRTLLLTDAAINIYPKLDDKVDIVQNAIDLAHVLGIVMPKVAILSAIETVSSKIISTIDAAALCKMADRGQISGAILDGPLAFDDAMSPEAANIKQIRSLVAGKADILVAPDLEAANMLVKEMEQLAGAEGAGVVLGARVPIILTSRADSAKSRLASTAVAAMLAHGQPRANPRG